MRSISGSTEGFDGRNAGRIKDWLVGGQRLISDKPPVPFPTP